MSFFGPTDDSLVSVAQFLGDGPFTMLNLFRLRAVADFSIYPDLEPAVPMSCRDLFDRYIAHMDQFLDQVGARRALLADGGPCLVGPADERWDVVQLVEYPSGKALMELGVLVVDEVRLREIVLADSRVVPLLTRPLDAVDTAGPNPFA